MKIEEMKQKRAALVKQARELLEKAEKENRELHQDESEQYDRIMADVDSRGKEIQREERLAEIESEMEQRTEDVPRNDPNPNPEQREQRNVHPRATEEYRDAFWRAVTAGRNALDAGQYDMLMSPEVRALAVGTDTAGGYVVPDEFERQLIKLLEEQNVMRGLATVIQTGSGTREIPIESDYGSATWLGEGAAYTESDSTFGQKTLSAYKLGTIIKVSEELINDSFFNMGNYVQSAFARRFATAEEAAFVNGNGTGKPTGVVQSATEGKAIASGQVNTVKADDLIDVFHSLSRVYRRQASWLMADSTVKAVRKLKDSTDGQYIWQPGLQAGQPDRLLGRPVAVSDDVPAMAASAKSILFGDFSHYWIADRQGRTMQRLDEKYADTGHVGYRMYQRVDGKLIRPDAVKFYQNSAT